MAISTQPFLALLTRAASGAAQLATITGATPTPIGNQFGSISQSTATADFAVSRVLRFRGNIYCMTNGNMYVSNGGSVTYSGTISVTNGNAAVVGTGTSFTTQLATSQVIAFASQPSTLYTIQSITDNTHLTLTGTYSGTTNASTTIIGATPTVCKTASSGIQANNACLGPFVVVLPQTGVLSLAYIYQISGQNSLTAVTSPDGATWTETTMSLTNANSNGDQYFNRYGIWRNQIHVGCSNASSSQTYFVDFSTMTGGVAASSASVTQPGYVEYCTFQNFFYRLRDGNKLDQLIGSAWSNVSTLTVPVSTGYSGASAQQPSTGALFDGGDGNMYAIWGVVSGGTYGWACSQIAVNASGTTFTITDITATVLPTIFRLGNNVSVSSHVAVAQEMESSPGTLSTHIYFNNAGNSLGGTVGYYFWNGNAALIGNSGSPNDSGGNTGYAIATPKFQGIDCGGYIWASNSYEVYFEANIGQLTGAATLQYTIYNPGQTGNTKSLSIYGTTNSSFGPSNTTALTLSNPSKISGSGNTPTLNANNIQIDNNSADGSTVYQVQVNGLTNGQRMIFAPSIF
jgi:hypothetical protein